MSEWVSVCKPEVYIGRKAFQMLRFLARRVYRDIWLWICGTFNSGEWPCERSQILKGQPSPCLQTSFIQPHNAVVTRQNPEAEFLPWRATAAKCHSNGYGRFCVYFQVYSGVDKCLRDMAIWSAAGVLNWWAQSREKDGITICVWSWHWIKSACHQTLEFDSVWQLDSLADELVGEIAHTV